MNRLSAIHMPAAPELVPPSDPSHFFSPWGSPPSAGFTGETCASVSSGVGFSGESCRSVFSWGV